MTSVIRALAQAVVSTLEAVLSRTALTGTAFDTQEYEGSMLVTLAAGAATAGTNPTLDVVLHHSDSASTGFEAISGAEFSQITDTAGVESLVLDRNSTKRYIKAVATFGGTNSPAFPFGLTFTGLKKYS